MAGWVKIPEEWLDDPTIEQLPAAVVLLHLTALAHCARHSTDGHLPRTAVRKLWPVAVEDLTPAIDRLVEVGFWQEEAAGWLIEDWQTFILSAEEVEHRRKLGKVRQERHRRHTAGDHSLCDRCSYVRNASRNASQSPSVTPPPIRTAPTQREERGGGASQAVSAGAPPAGLGERHAFDSGAVVDLESGDPASECCDLPAEDPIHNGWVCWEGDAPHPEPPGEIQPHPYNLDDDCCPFEVNQGRGRALHRSQGWISDGVFRADGGVE